MANENYKVLQARIPEVKRYFTCPYAHSGSLITCNEVDSILRNEKVRPHPNDVFMFDNGTVMMRYQYEAQE